LTTTGFSFSGSDIDWLCSFASFPFFLAGIFSFSFCLDFGFFSSIFYFFGFADLSFLIFFFVFSLLSSEGFY
jgi:hypothetical protein